MLRLAICDDSENELELVQKYTEEYKELYRAHFEVSVFSKPEALLYEIQDGSMADIFLLDVEMPVMNGFELAEEIRKYSSSAVIIFLTSHSELAARGYKVKALRYIQKLNIREELFEALDSAITELGRQNESTVLLRRYNDYRRVPYGEIISVRRIARRLEISTSKQGTLTDLRGLREFFDALGDDRFLMIDRSSFVNVDFVTSISGDSLETADGQSHAVSRGSVKRVKEALMKRWS